MNHDKPVKATNISNSNAHANADADWNTNSNANDTHTKEDTTWSDSPKVAVPGAWSEWDWDLQNNDQTRVHRTEVVKPDDTWSLDWGRPESPPGETSRAPMRKKLQTNWGWDSPPVRTTLRNRNANATTGDWESDIGNVRDWAWTPSITGSADDAAG